MFNKFLIVVISILIFYSPFLCSGDNNETLAEFKPEMSDEFISLMKNADLAAGEMLFMRKCSSCHDHEEDGGHSKGPHLWNVIGRQAGSAQGFEYSPAMRNSGHRWDLASLNYYLSNTERAVPGRSMNFRGIRRDTDRAKLLAFLATLSDKPTSP